MIYGTTNGSGDLGPSVIFFFTLKRVLVLGDMGNPRMINQTLCVLT